MENLDYDTQFERVKKDVVEAFTKALGIEAAGTNRKIVVNKVWVDDNKNTSDWESQREAVRKDKTWGVPVYASLDLTDRKTGEVFSTAKRLKLATLPKNTDLGSFIVNGKHYQVQNQLRRKPGIYVTEKKSGEKKTEINIAGRPFDVMFDKEKAAFSLIRGGGQNKTGIPLYPILSRLGISDADMAKAWGEDVLTQNKTLSTKKQNESILRAAEYFTRSKFDSPDDAVKAIGDFLAESQVRPEVTAETVGKAYKSVSPQAILRGSIELLKAERGDRKADDRQAMEFKKIVTMADLVKERMIQPNGELARKLSSFRTKIGFRLNNKKAPPTDISRMVSSNEFTSLFSNFFSQSELSNITDQTNPLNIINGMTKVTILGEGGVMNMESVRDEERGVHPSQMGFIDPIHTPDSDKIGAVMNLPIGVRRKGEDLQTRIIDPRKKTTRFVSPAEMKNLKVAFPDQYVKGEFVDKKVKALVAGNLRIINSEDVDAILSSPKQAFSISSNTIPFLPSVQAVRGQMATKMLEQAIPLTHREAPLVQVKAGRTTMEAGIGEGFSIKAKEDGVIESVTPNRIVIKTKDGEVAQPIYNNFKLNKKSFLHADPTVKVGQKVVAGDVIADSNFTKDGVLAIGTNLRTAYIPYKGLNFEDGIVITESAAEKLSSEHIHEHAVSPDKGDEFDLDGFLAWSPGALDDRQTQLLDKSGVVRKGQVIKKGDPLWVGTRENKYDPEYIAMKKLAPNRSPKRGHMEKWTKDVDGEVVDVIRTGKKVKVYVKTREPAMIGDKLTSRHGAKGILTKIIADGEAPHTKDGEPVDILLNPHGIVSRINPSQMLETVAAKMAQKVGVPYVVDNFSGEDYLESIKGALKKTKVSDKETLYDPHSKKALGEILVGPQYFLKLNKQATSQFSARSDGKYDSNKSPLRGGDDGAKSLDLLTFYSMLAHGSRANLREMATYKASQNPQFWNWLSGGNNSGLVKPPPVPTFAYRKFEAYLKASGVNMQRRGSKMIVSPMTDKHIANMSNGEITEPIFVRGKDLREEKGGLLDIDKTGGKNGEKWSHIQLAEPVANPAFEKPIKHLTGLGAAQFTGLVEGKLFVDPKTGEFADEGITGGAAIKKKLSLIDIDKEILFHTDAAKKAKSTKKLDSANKSLKYLYALKKLGIKPEEAYVQSKIAVLPPQFRPVIEMEDGQISNPGINTLYRDVGLVSNELKWQNSIDYLPDDVKSELRSDLYKGTRAVAGLGDPTFRYPKSRAPKGLIAQIAGTGSKAKEGFFIKRVLKRNQDLVGRGTIIPDPKLGLDEVGLPEEMSWNLFEPFVTRRLVNSGGKRPNDAIREVKDRTPGARAALEAEMANRPILLNRAPSLHKFSIMAFKPKMTDGKAIKIPPLVVKGFNADFDGDCTLGEIIIATSGDRMSTAGMPHTGSIASFQIVDLKEFPRVLGSENVKKSGVREFDVPENTYVPCYLNGAMKVLPVTKYSIHPDCEAWAIVTRNGREITCSSDHSLALLDPETLLVTKASPVNSIGMCLPTLRGFDNPTMYSHFKGGTVAANGIAMVEDVPATRESGWLIGASAGDGWVTTNKKSGSKQVNLAHGKGGDEVQHEWRRLALRLSNKSIATIVDMPHTFDGTECNSTRTTVASSALGRWLEPFIGKGSRNKHLPPRFLETPEDFRRGLFCGLIDTDGTSCWSKKGQYALAFSTTSDRLSREIQLLGLSLGLPSGKTDTSTPKGNDAWVVTFSTRPVQDAKWIVLHAPHKMNALLELQRGDRKEYGRNDFVPMTEKARSELLIHLRALGASRRLPNRNGSAFSQYVVLKRKQPTITRESASKLKDLISSRVTSGYLEKWFSIALDATVGWDVVETAKATGEVVEMYDLTVPESWNFTMSNGAVVWDTMTVHVPILPDAVREAERMLPSNNLFSPGTGQIMIQPQNEAALGLYQMSKDKDGSKQIVSLLPKELQKEFSGVTLNKKNLGRLMRSLADNSPREHGKVIDKLKELGDEHTYRTGFTVGLSDLTPSIPEREGIFSSTQKSIGKLNLDNPKDVEKAQIIMDAANSELERALDKSLGKQGNNFHMMVSSGARGNMTQLKQIVSSPFMVPDHKGDPILVPVTRSFAQGLKFSDYWSTLYGSRTVATEKQMQTSKPGAFNKDIMSTVVTNVISGDDCGVRKGVMIGTSSSDIDDRFLAKDISVNGTVIANAGSLVTTGLLNTMRDRKVGKLEVRSPLTCRKPKGTCGKCYGLNEDGQAPSIGDNIGAVSGQALSEPLTQMTLRTFHSGGVSKARGVVTGYEKIDKLLKMQKIKKGKATLALMGGKVESVNENTGRTGRDVLIASKKHFIPNELWDSSRVQVGKKIEKGDIISYGIAQPDELADLKGMLPAQEYIVDEIQDAYKREGVNLKRRAVETVLRSVGNTTKVLDPGDSAFLPGDVAPWTVVKDYNESSLGKKSLNEALDFQVREDLPGVKKGSVLTPRLQRVLELAGIDELEVGPKPIQHKPFLKGVRRIPLLRDDWMSQMGYQSLRDAIVSGAARGAESDIHGYAPVPAFAFGAEFGDAPDGKSKTTGVY